MAHCAKFKYSQLCPSELVTWTSPEYEAATLPYASSGVIVNQNEEANPIELGAVTLKWVADPAETLMGFDVPVVDGIMVSVAVIVWFPAVLNVAVKLPEPFVSVASCGSVALRSVLVK